MSSEPWPDGVGRLVLAETDSTNAEALRRLGTLDRPTWILALRQTAARGRRGRPWQCPPGSFAATLALRPDAPPERVSLLSYAAALALADALAAVGSRGIALKWPNDVLIGGAKVAGILLESTGRADRVDRLAIGFGVNLATAPEPGRVEPGALRPVALAEAGIEVGPEALLDRLAPAFAHWQATLAAEGFEPVRRAWLARAARLGETVTARTGQAALVGRFETLDPSGALVLATADGRRAVAAADIFF